MPDATSSTGNRGGNPQDLTRLFLRLDADAKVAEEKYKGIRSRLVKFFECNHCPEPEDLADSVLDRVASKLNTEDIRDVTQFCIGVARKIFLEAYKRERREIHIEDLPGGPNAWPDLHDQATEIENKIDEERRRACLEECLSQLEATARKLVLLFYSSEAKLQIPFRKELARSFGISPENLRVCACRIRRRLEPCVTLCLKSAARAGSGLRERY
jgi:RNA polymerase sigma factor (sigma-70 family)